jgi:hypothetical protein
MWAGCRSQAARSTLKCTGASRASSAKTPGHRAQVAAPHTLAPAIDDANSDGRHRGAAQDHQHRARVFVHADQLAVERGPQEADQRPARPAHPAWNRQALAGAPRKFGQCAFGAHHAAPEAPNEQHGRNDKRPPHAPERELCKARQAGEHARVFGRHGQESWHRHEHEIQARRCPTAAARCGCGCVPSSRPARQARARCARHDVHAC